MDVKPIWIPTWHQMGQAFMVTCISFKTHLLEVGLSQNQETMALRNLPTIDLLYFIMRKDPAWMKIHWNSIWLRVQSHVTSHYTRGPVTTPHAFGSVLGRPLVTSFGLSQNHGHGSRLMDEVEPEPYTLLSLLGPSYLLIWLTHIESHRLHISLS